MNSQINLWIIPTRSEGTPDSQQYEVTSFPHPCFQWQHHPDEMPVKACGKMLINEKLESRADATTRHSCCFSFLYFTPSSSFKHGTLRRGARAGSYFICIHEWLISAGADGETDRGGRVKRLQDILGFQRNVSGQQRTPTAWFPLSALMGGWEEMGLRKQK